MLPDECGHSLTIQYRSVAIKQWITPEVQNCFQWMYYAPLRVECSLKSIHRKEIESTYTTHICYRSKLTSSVRINSCVIILCIPNVRFLWRALLKTLGLQSILFMKDGHKMLEWRQFVLLILTTTFNRFQALHFLFFLRNGYIWIPWRLKHL